MALPENEKYILIMILAVTMLFVVFFEMKYMRGKTREVRRAAQRKDEAFNAIHTTRSVINVMDRRGADTEVAQNLVKMAKDAWEGGQYDRCMELCEKARNDLVLPSSSKSAPEGGVENDTAAKERFEKAAEQILSSEGDSGGGDSYKGTKLTADKDGNFLSARFEMNTAKTDIKNALEKGADTSEAQSYLTDAEGAFVAGNYTKALSLAVKSRKSLGSSVKSETIHLKARPEPEEPEAEPTAEESSVPATGACRTCGAPLDPGDMFCHKCGAKVDQEKFCKSCGERARAADVFCRQCGARVG